MVRKFNTLLALIQRCFNYVKECWYTYRFVDNYSEFPAFRINSNFPMKIVKAKGAILSINGKLILQPWMNGKVQSSLTLGADARLEIESNFSIGDDVRITVDKGAILKIGGSVSSHSGITAKSVVMVKKTLEIGHDCIIAWDTFITDCDWHQVGENVPYAPTIIKEHVWLGVGVKVLKGVTIEKDCIVTTNSVLLKGVYGERALISGSPAKIINQSAPIWHSDMKLF